MAAPVQNNAVPDPQSLIPNPGLYIHVPFCSAICNYCNFNRGLFDSSVKTSYVTALLEEIRTGAGPRRPLTAAPDTLYFGGGTPSLLSPGEIDAIIGECVRSIGLMAGAEITLEANPESVDGAALDAFRAAGVNRLSFGVQSFRDEELVRLGRLHSADRAKQVVALARAAGYDNVSVDLMMGLPGQNVAQWIVSVEQAIALSPDHLSLYILEVYPHLPLKQEIDRNGWEVLGDEAVAEMYETAMAMLDRAGYEQYEISNVSRPGRQSRHNLKYWSDGNWLGFGPGAHSTWEGTRWRNVSSTGDYVEHISAGQPAWIDRRILSPEERLGDALFTGLRLSAGIDLSAFSLRYATDIWDRFGARLRPFCDAGILAKDENRLHLTRTGMLVANEVMSVFV